MEHGQSTAEILPNPHAVISLIPRPLRNFLVLKASDGKLVRGLGTRLHVGVSLEQLSFLSVPLAYHWGRTQRPLQLWRHQLQGKGGYKHLTTNDEKRREKKREEGRRVSPFLLHVLGGTMVSFPVFHHMHYLYWKQQ